MTINPGIAELLSDHTGLTTVKNSTFNPYSDYAFTGTNCTVGVPFMPMRIQVSSGWKVYTASLRFSVYCANWSTVDTFFIGKDDRLGSGTNMTHNYYGFHFSNGNIYLDADKTILVAENVSNGFHDCALSAYFTQFSNSASTSTVAFIFDIDNVSVAKIIPFQYLFDGPYAAGVATFPASGSVYVSNIMTDNRVIYSTEKVFSVPLYKLTGNMTEEDGFHIASNANDSLQMGVNYSPTLRDKVGGDKVRVTNVMLVGNPAYRVGDTLTQLTASHKVGFGTSAVTTAMGTATLQTNQDSVCTFTKALSNTVFFDLNDNSTFANTSFIFTAS